MNKGEDIQYLIETGISQEHTQRNCDTCKHYGALSLDCGRCDDECSQYEPKQRTGWHIAHGMYEDRFWRSCGYIKVMDSSMAEWKYCPKCGRKMENGS